MGFVRCPALGSAAYFRSSETVFIRSETSELLNE